MEREGGKRMKRRSGRKTRCKIEIQKIGVNDEIKR